MRSPVKLWREKEERYKHLDKVGRIVSFTKIHEAPDGFKGQYMVGIIEVDKVRVVGQIVGEVKTGDKVVGVLRRLGDSLKQEVIEYGVKWKRL